VKKSLAKADTAQLVAALGDDVQYWRLLAQKNLVEGKKTDATDLLKKLVLANDGNVAAIHALHTLQGLGALDEATHKAALLAKDARLRRNAVRALGTDAAAQALFFGAGIFADPDLQTRLAAFVKLAEFPTTPEIKTLATKLTIDPVIKKDEWLSEAAKLLAKKHGANAFKEGPNLLVNGGLEELGPDGLPVGWKRRDYGGEPKKKGNAGAEWKIVSGGDKAHSGKNALLCITRDDADTSFFQDVKIKPNTTYRLSGWVKTHALKGKVSFNDHLGRAETEQLRARESGWVEVETIFDSKERTTASINILHVAKGDGSFDDVKLAELLPTEEIAEKALVGSVQRGEQVFLKHPTAACVLCHALKGQGSAVGPAMDGIAARKDATYIKEALLEPNKILADGFQQLGVSPMPPMGLILKPQELADIEAFLQTLK
jgi:mono/diheme cytochrome c family protein